MGLRSAMFFPSGRHPAYTFRSICSRLRLPALFLGRRGLSLLQRQQRWFAFGAACYLTLKFLLFLSIVAVVALVSVVWSLFSFTSFAFSSFFCSQKVGV
jgi:hypothetical protein